MLKPKFAPMYHVMIHEINTEQTVYRAVHHGELGSLLEEGGIISESVKFTDQGRQVPKPLVKKAFRHVHR